MEIDQKEWFNLTDEEKEKIHEHNHWVYETNESLSTDILESDVENRKITIHIPKDVAVALELDNEKRKAIEEIRKKRNGFNRFPEGSVEVLDKKKFIDDINEVQKKYIFEQYNSATLQAFENELKLIFEQIKNKHSRYIQYI